ncbi:MAG TPA: response regulator, partial [Ramlibacter sp.]|nr:response regulator [Ramlibacter sp.]
ATVLGDGRIVPIVNPVVLAQRVAGGKLFGTTTVLPALEETRPQAAPVIMVVDDSLTVRKITSRLLEREGYQVLTAKDGLDALEQLRDVLPCAMLVDIEMPRMDGFDLARNIRGDERLKHLPIVMITSRIAEKHREHAKELGVNHYLGKPYSEEELLSLVKHYCTQAAMA